MPSSCFWTTKWTMSARTPSSPQRRPRTTYSLRYSAWCTNLILKGALKIYLPNALFCHAWNWKAMESVLWKIMYLLPWRSVGSPNGHLCDQDRSYHPGKQKTRGQGLNFNLHKKTLNKRDELNVVECCASNKYLSTLLITWDQNMHQEKKNSLW